MNTWYEQARLQAVLESLRSALNKILHPREFNKKYKLTQAELADLLGVSIQLVKSWFAHKEPRQPEQRYLDRLSEIDALLEIQKVINTKIPPHLRKLFDLN